jgi:hypothetical protein
MMYRIADEVTGPGHTPGELQYAKIVLQRRLLVNRSALMVEAERLGVSYDELLRLVADERSAA